MSRGNRSWNPYAGRGNAAFQVQKSKPLFSVNNFGAVNRIPQDGDKTGADNSFSTTPEPESYAGWKLYFPEKSFKESYDIVRRVKAMERHFKTYVQLYDYTDIEENCEVNLKIDQLATDQQLNEDWSTFYDEAKTKATQTLACVGLAMHNVLIQSSGLKTTDKLQHRKIFVRPHGFGTPSNFDEAFKTKNELISVTGTAYHAEEFDFVAKMVCFRCLTCSTELAVKQKSNKLVYPSSCHKGCPARGRFVQVTGSPFTIIHTKQMIRLKESHFKDIGETQGLDVELTQNHVDLAVPGSLVTISGVMKHRVNKAQSFLKKGEGKRNVSYLKCFSIQIHNKLAPLRTVLSEQNMEFVNLMMSEPSIFRILVHSLCPSIFGHEEIKAGLILSLLSGKDMMPMHRSESHILLVGNPGTGKSKLLQACTEVSTKGYYVNGPTSTTVGLTAKVGADGSIEAGALILADEGVCCIDEFDKMKSHAHALLECMEQQVISITKSGVMNNSPARAVVIAASNPSTSFYDRSKTILQNVKITPQLLSRFDLIFPIANHSRQNDQKFLQHASGRHKLSSQKNFFSQSSTSSRVSTAERQKNLKWLHLDIDEKLEALPTRLLKVFIEYARDNIKPTLSQEARIEIKTFFKQLKSLSVGESMQRITFRHLEGLIRLTLARARADLETVATREHAFDAINLCKFTMIDWFASDDPVALSSNTGFPPSKKQAISFLSMSKPKQKKAFLEHLQSEVEIQERDTFTSAELKAMGRELGIKDIEDIIYKLNDESFILKTAEGYRVT